MGIGTCELGLGTMVNGEVGSNLANTIGKEGANCKILPILWPSGVF
jgi:hypothetical protein